MPDVPPDVSQADAPGESAAPVTGPDTAGGSCAPERPEDTKELPPDGTGPDWLELAVLAPAVVVAVVSVTGLGLGLAGVFRSWLAVAIGFPLSALCLMAVGRPQRRLRAAERNGAVLAAVLCAGFFVVAALFPSQHLLVDRDPASYNNTARWLASEGSFSVEARSEGFELLEGLRYHSAAVYDVGDGRLQFQFNHLTTVPMAIAYDVGGWKAMFRVPAALAALGLFALYAVARAATGRPLLSLLAPTMLGVGPVMLYVARDSFSEPLTFLLLWSAAAAGVVYARRAGPGAALVTGVLIGAAIASRADGLLLAALALPLSLVPLARVPGRRFRVVLGSWAVLVGSAAAIVTVGMVDLVAFTGSYVDAIESQLILGRSAVAIAAVGGLVGVVLWRRRAAPARHVQRFAPAAGTVVAVLVVLLVAGLWFVRPLVQQVESAELVYSGVAEIQERDGLPIEPARHYSEQSVRWTSWYLGVPAMLLATFGAAVAIRRTSSGRATTALVMVTAFGLATAFVFWWDPTITPDQLWASRRFVPSVLPSLAVFAVVGLAALGAWPPWRRQGAAVRHIGTGLVAALVLAPVVWATAPIVHQRSQSGFHQPVAELCSSLSDDAAVIVVGAYAEISLPQTIRSWCGVPAAGAQHVFRGGSVQERSELLRSVGRRLYLVGIEEGGPRGAPGAEELPGRWTNGALDRWTAQRTLDRLPRTYVPWQAALPTGDPFRFYVIDSWGSVPGGPGE